MADQHRVTQRDAQGRAIGWKGTAKAPVQPEESEFDKWHKKKYGRPAGIDRAAKFREYEDERKKKGGWGNSSPPNTNP